MISNSFHFFNLHNVNVNSNYSLHDYFTPACFSFRILLGLWSLLQWSITAGNNRLKNIFSLFWVKFSTDKTSSCFYYSKKSLRQILPSKKYDPIWDSCIWLELSLGPAHEMLAFSEEVLLQYPHVFTIANTRLPMYSAEPTTFFAPMQAV